ncbi:MAG: glycosyltransferase family 4 protein [Phycisphaerae bacterium]|nr:glycosyltransferase family 4 protein [Phycisphaerae bacterium]
MKRTRHLLFINEFFHPDICASAAVLTDRLPRIVRLRPDYRITVIAGNRAWDDPSVVHPAADEYRGVRIIRVNRPAVSRTSLVRRALGFAAFHRAAVRAARSMDRIDLVVATTAPPQGADIARKIARQRGCHYVYTVLDLYPDLATTLGRLRHGGLIHRRWLARDTRAMRDAATIVSIAARVTARIARTRDVPRTSLRTIHDGFDPDRLELVGPNDFQRQYNPERKFVVQYAGNMGLSHPFDTILAAANALANDGSILLQFIGDGPQRPHVQAHLPQNAQLIDYQPADRLCQVLATADVCLVSQQEEMFDKSLPYKIYAILAAKKPVIFIGSPQSEIAEWLEQAGAGRHVSQGDPDRLADIIRELKTDPSRANAMARAAEALFDKRFHAERAAQQWATLIDELVDSAE